MTMTAELRLEFVRATRDRLLYITDTLMHDDRPDVDLAELKTYRQALRDITKEEIGADENGHPVITFPTKPQCVIDVELNFAPLTKEFQRNQIIPSWNPPVK
tara:strand:+ start:63 stop:368 length:306 start_codon:yes stop_codon:yes gene_type:complete